MIRATLPDDYFKPEKCELRVYLRSKGEPERKPGPFEEVLAEFGIRHEKHHLASLLPFEDASGGDITARFERTKQLVLNRARAIYQPVLIATGPASLGSEAIVGVPDLLILEDDNHVIRDAKLSRHANELEHPEILRQLELYGWLFEQCFGHPPLRLEVVLGNGEIESVPDDGGAKALELLAHLRSVANSSSAPYEPVGWSKCNPCGFFDRCWPKAMQVQDPAVVPGIDQGLARALQERGINTIQKVLDSFGEDALSSFQRPWGRSVQKVGKRAAEILRNCEAMMSGKPTKFAPIALPGNDEVVIFDIEGMPPFLEYVEKVYMWGLQVYGKRPGSYQVGLAGFGADGDKEGWLKFLEISEGIFKVYGDIPFVHWHNYERAKVKLYLERYGDRDGVGSRVLQHLVDLHLITTKSVAIPEPSFSLKVLEKPAGFVRTMEEYGGEWSMAQYIRAVESQDDRLRQSVMTDIKRYNEEDLAATWAVFQWLRSL